MGAINIAAVVNAVRQAEIVALSRVAEGVERDAKARAPVRKVFKEPAGHRRAFRDLTDAEKALATKRAIAHPYSTDFQRRQAVGHIRYYARAEVPRRGSANSLKASRQLRILGFISGGKFKSRGGASPTRPNSPTQGGYHTPSLDQRLTARGRYEVRSGRAVTYQVTGSGSVRVQVGGRLKASILAGEPVSGETGTTVRVTAGVRYAKFVEFPTTHNAAQPFLLPALQDHREHLRSELAAEIRSRLGG